MVLGNRRLRRARNNDPVRQELQKSRESHARNQKEDYSHCFRSKSRMDFLRLSSIMCGVELAYAAEMAFVSPILLKIGVEHWVMTMVWGIAPCLGFIMSPLIGSFSDRCRSQYGRRRPLILILGAGIVAGLLLVPHCLEIGQFFGDPEYVLADPDRVDSEERTDEAFKYKWALIITIIGTILLDFNADLCQSPARVYLMDVSIHQDHSKGLSAFGIACGIGSFCGFVICTIDWNAIHIGQWFGGNISTVFTACTIILIVTIICTVTSFREIPLPLLEADEQLRPVTQAVVRQEYEKRRRKAEILKVSSDNNCSVVAIEGDIESDEGDETHVTLVQYLQSVVAMPKSIRILCVTHLFTKMALLSYSLYFTDFVGEVIFKGTPTGPAHLLYEQGVRFGCWGLAAFALSCTLYSFVIDHLIKLLGAKIVYIGGLSLFSVGMIFLAIWPMKWTVILISFSSGIMYSTAFTIPYLVLAQYHSSGSFKQKNGEAITSTQIRGLGTDVSIIHSMIFIGQMIVSLTSGPLISLINSVQAVIYAAGVFAAISAISASQIVYMDL